MSLWALSRRPRPTLRFLGTVLQVVLPIVGVLAVPHYGGVLYVVLVFVVAMVLAHVGSTLRHGYVDPLAALQDVGIALLMSGGALLAERLTAGEGGGPVDPALLAVLGAYLLLAWPAWRRQT